jgi:hypothetical protein
MRLAELAGRPFERDVYDHVGRAAEFLYQLTDRTCGRAPQYGNDDGACVLPITECDLHDFRPVIQSSHFLVHRKRLFPEGPWDEEMHWLFGDEAASAATCNEHKWGSAAFDAGGYYKLARDSSWAMIRCHDYRDRPGQCDSLHVDLWWKGTNVLRDCGTFRYYHPENRDLERYFTARAAHNTVVVDGAEPMHWVTRFLWVPFPRARCTRFDGEARVFEGRQLDYDRSPWNVLHRRTVIALDEAVWLIVDDFLGRGAHALELRWHLADEPCRLDSAAGEIHLSTSSGPVTVLTTSRSGASPEVSVRRDQRRPPMAGLAAPYYSACVGIPSVVVQRAALLPERLVTAVGLGVSARAHPEGMESGQESWRIESADALWHLQLGNPQRSDSAVYLGCRHDPRGVLNHVQTA